MPLTSLPVSLAACVPEGLGDWAMLLLVSTGPAMTVVAGGVCVLVAAGFGLVRLTQP